MKKIFAIIVLFAYSVLGFCQILSVGVDQVVPMNDLHVIQGANVGYTFDLRKVELGANLGFTFGDKITHNLVYSTSLQLFKTSRFKAFVKGGFGWGHVYTKEVTDHNYHTYLAGINLRYMIKDRLWLYLEPSINCRTYAEHIGFSRDRAWYCLNIGVQTKL